MNIKMTEKMKNPGVMTNSGTLGKILPTATLLGLLLLAPKDGFAQNMSNMNEGKGAFATEVTTPKFDEKKISTIKDLLTTMGDKLGGDSVLFEDKKDLGITVGEGKYGGILGEKEKNNKIDKKESRIGVHGFVQVGTSVVPDFANICSDEFSVMLAIDAKDMKTGLGLTVIRLDDFHKNPDYPWSKASVLVPYGNYSSRDGKRSGGASVEFSFSDQLPGDVGVTPVVVGSYSTNGWTFEGKYFHDIREGKDMDAFRLGITKKIGYMLSLTTQGWYKSDYSKKVYFRGIVDVNFGGGFCGQMSCIIRNGEIIPTRGVIYKY